MVYQRVSKPSSGNSHIHKKDSASTTPAMPVQAKSDSASPQEQEMPSYTPLAANWATNNNLMRSLSGTSVVQRQEESGKEEMEPIQAKLTIGQVGDKYEQEADQTAQRVVSQINSPAPQQSSQSQSLQREEMPEDELQMKPASGIIQREEMPQEDEELQMKPAFGTIQREEMPQEDELQMKPAFGTIQREDMPQEDELQMKPMVQRKSNGGGMDATPDLEASIQQAKGGGQPLANNIREPMEKAFGADFSGVNVHTDAHSDQLNQSIQAKAFTTGKDVFFRQGAYDPGSRGGQELIAHELTHVVQQNGGAVQRRLSNEPELQSSKGVQASRTPTHLSSKLTSATGILQCGQLSEQEREDVKAKKAASRSFWQNLNNPTQQAATKPPNDQSLGDKSTNFKQTRQFWQNWHDIEPKAKQEAKVRSEDQQNQAEAEVNTALKKLQQDQNTKEMLEPHLTDKLESKSKSEISPNSQVNETEKNAQLIEEIQPLNEEAISRFKEQVELLVEELKAIKEEFERCSKDEKKEQEVRNKLMQLMGEEKRVRKFLKQKINLTLARFQILGGLEAFQNTDDEQAEIKTVLDKVPELNELYSNLSQARIETKVLVLGDNRNITSKKEDAKYQNLLKLKKSYRIDESKQLRIEGQDIRGLEDEDKKTVRYLTPEQREKYRIKAVKQGEETIYVDENNNPVDSKDATQTQSSTGSTDGLFIFVMSEDGELHVADEGQESKGNEKFHHSSFLGGKPVAAAGEIEFSSGTVRKISNASGHYQPDLSYMYQALLELSSQGMSLSGVTVTLVVGIDFKIKNPKGGTSSFSPGDGETVNLKADTFMAFCESNGVGKQGRSKVTIRELLSSLNGTDKWWQ